jgi:hypothetical protein
MKPMTPGQRLIWAAMFAQSYYDRHERPRLVLKCTERCPSECDCEKCNPHKAAVKACEDATCTIAVLEDLFRHADASFDSEDDPSPMRLEEMLWRVE